MAKKITKKQVQQMSPEEQDRLYGRFFTFDPDEMDLNAKPPAKKKPAAKSSTKPKTAKK